MVVSESIQKELKRSINHSTGYIHEKRALDGLWYDFDTLAGASSEWVSGYILSTLSLLSDYSCPIDRAHKILLTRQRANGGWAYNHKVPTDADSTSWVMMSFSGLPLWRPSAMIRGINFIRDHFNHADGGFTTYAPKDHIEQFIEANKDLTKGWLGSHTCVTAVALQSLLFNKLHSDQEIINKGCRFLTENQQSNKLWNSYWWQGNAYSTFHCLKTLLLAKHISIRDAKKVIDEVISRMSVEGYWVESNNDSSLFSTALFLRTVLLLPDKKNLKAVSKCVDYLLQSQLTDGSWPSAPILRIPPPMITNPETLMQWKTGEMGTGVIIEDQNKLFTTATISSALHLYNKMFLN